MISAIVLAAGESRRMGQQKVLLPFGPSTILEEILRAIEGSHVAETIVVTGHNPTPIEELLAGRAVTMVHNDHYLDGGMLSSIRRGLQAVDPATTGVMLFLGDQPQVSTPLINHLIDAFTANEGQILVPSYEGRRGHPFLFDVGYRQTILEEFDDTGLRGLLQRHPDRVQELPWDDAHILNDLDTPEDYARALPGTAPTKYL